MTELQRARSRKLAAEERAKLAAGIERFKKGAASVSTDHSDKANVFTSYADAKIKGLSLRDYEQPYATSYFGIDQEQDLHLRWFLKRPGHRALDLGDGDGGDIDPPELARRWAQRLLDGCENAIVNAYIDNTPDVDKHDCPCFRTSELLMDKTLDELQSDLFWGRRRLASASEEGPAVVRRYACHLMPERCRLHHLEAMLKRYAKFREREGLKIRIKTKPAEQAA
jgi:hypothetical protein